jgi:uncharacterized protein (DUF1015 family)
MATLHPFRAVRPDPKQVEDIASVPYDVINTEEARAMAAGVPTSFLHVIRPEIDLPEGTDEHDDAVYGQGAENMEAFVSAPYTRQEATPSLYVYRLVMNGREQTGLFSCVSVAEYDKGTIVKHEKTRPVKETDRTRHILMQQAHAEPVMLTYRDEDAVHALVAQVQETDPLYDLEADDGVRHTIWRVDEPEAFVDAFRAVYRLYIADGHHRCKAASRAADVLREEVEQVPSTGLPEFEFFPAVLFPMSHMHIMAYNRVVLDLPEPPTAFRETLQQRFDLVPVADPVPDEKGTVCLYLDDEWLSMRLPEATGERAVDQLDVARLSEAILEPLLDITDPRRDPNIDFVGGIRGTDALEHRVDEGNAQLAVSMYPTAIEELLAVSDEGSLMPPKSTWFEPKLRSGLLVHDFADDVPRKRGEMGPADTGISSS